MSDRRFLLAAKAADDLQSIASYIGERNPLAAERVLKTLYQSFSALGAHPDLGALRSDLRPGLRVFSPPRPAHNYVVLYYRSDDGVEINGVLHGAREWEGLIARGER